jgi:hypothetical protein
MRRTKIMNKREKGIYTAKTHTTGGRDGASRSSDGRLDVNLSTPGTAGVGTNPEQFFAAGWSACWLARPPADPSSPNPADDSFSPTEPCFAPVLNESFATHSRSKQTWIERSQVRL